MAVRNWHWGKLVLLWIWAAVLGLLAWSELERGQVPWWVGLPLMALLTFLPVTLSVLTWKWLGGQETQPAATPLRPHADDTG